jgi:hypothetical protein
MAKRKSSPQKSKGGSMRPRMWSSLEDQLAEAKVRPETVLGRLIKDNQDFNLLQPEEANDDFGLPLWLRVYWRKKHPDVQHSTVNPGAGYPDVLYDIYAWMMSHHDLPSGAPNQPTGTKGDIP